MDTNLLSKQSKNAELYDNFHNYKLCPLCKGTGEINLNSPIMSNENKEVFARIDELNKAFPKMEGEYYYKRHDELTKELTKNFKEEQGIE